MSITDRLSEFCADLSVEILPSEVSDRTPVLLLDLLGNIVRGARDAVAAPALFSAVEALGFGMGRSPVFGHSRRFSPAGAAFLNAALAHSLGCSDVTIFPSVLAGSDGNREFFLGARRG